MPVLVYIMQVFIRKECVDETDGQTYRETDSGTFKSNYMP